MSKKREAFFTKVGGAFSVHCRPITTAAVGEHRPRLARLTRARGTHRPPTSQQIDKLATLAPPPCIRCARLHPVFAPPPRSHLFPLTPGVNQKPPARGTHTTSRPPSTTSTGTHPVTRLTPHPVSATLHPRNPYPPYRSSSSRPPSLLLPRR